MDAVAAVGIGVGSAAVMAVLTRPILLRLPQRVGPDTDLDGRRYAELGSFAFVAGLALTSGLLVAVAARLLPPAATPLWLVLGTIGLLLAGIDARTTWLPLPLTRAAWACSAVAAITGAVLAGDGWSELLVRSAAGAAAAALLFGGVWWLSRGGLGFGDVRYAPLVGAAAGAADWSLIWTALLLGALVGGAWGLLRLIRRRREPFAYAPSMFAGAWLALGWAALVS